MASEVYRYNSFGFLSLGLYEVSNLQTPVESEMDLVSRIVVAAGKIAEDPRDFKRVRQSILKRYQTCIDVGYFLRTLEKVFISSVPT